MPKWLAITFLIFGGIFLAGGTGSSGRTGMIIIGIILTALGIMGISKYINIQPIEYKPTPQKNSTHSSYIVSPKKNRSPLAILRDVLIIIILLPIVVMIIVIGSATSTNRSVKNNNTQQTTTNKLDNFNDQQE